MVRRCKEDGASWWSRRSGRRARQAQDGRFGRVKVSLPRIPASAAFWQQGPPSPLPIRPGEDVFQLLAGPDAELQVHVAPVVLDRLRAEEQGRGGLPVVRPLASSGRSAAPAA